MIKDPKHIRQRQEQNTVQQMTALTAEEARTQEHRNQQTEEQRKTNNNNETWPVRLHGYAKLLAKSKENLTYVPPPFPAFQTVTYITSQP